MSEKADITISKEEEQSEATANNDLSADIPAVRHPTEYARRLVPPPVLPSGELVNAKNTLQSFAVPAAEVQQHTPLPNDDYQTRPAAAAAAFPPPDASVG